MFFPIHSVYLNCKKHDVCVILYMLPVYKWTCTIIYLINMLGKKYLPILHIRSTLNSLRTQHLLDKIESAAKMNNGAMAIVVDLPHQMPVQLDHIAQLLRHIRRTYSFPIYGFTHSECSPESYYLLSIATHIITCPSTVFTFRTQLRRISYDSMFERMKIKKNISMSQ